MACTISGMLLFCVLLGQKASALRVDRPHQQDYEVCEPEPPSFLQNDLPEIPTSLERSREFKGGLDFEEYMRNLSFVRTCPSVGDHVEALSPLVVPSIKLAFCYMPKVACTNFKDLVNDLNGFSRRLEGFGHDYLVSSRYAMRVPLDNLTKRNGWKFAVFTRDPALRYLSAFGSTCVSQNDRGLFEHSFECCGPLIRSNQVPAETMIKAFHERVMSDLKKGIVKMDDHWSQQITILRQCGWYKFKPDKLNFHGTLRGDVNGQVKAMLKMVNKNADELVDRLFPKEHVGGHTSPIHMAAEHFYNNKTILEAVMKLYEDDYKNFPNIGCAFTDPMMKKLTMRENLAMGGNLTLGENLTIGESA